jgi:hypothetical protein
MLPETLITIGTTEEEWYPVVCLCDATTYYADCTLSVSESQLAEWTRIFEEFHRVQHDLKRLRKTHVTP